MEKSDLDVEYFSDEEIENVSIDNIVNNIKTFDNDKLCSIIVCNRYLGTHTDLAQKCMEELSVRRSQGDHFNFEKKISEELSSLPNINLLGGDIGSHISNLLKNVKVEK